MSWQKCMSFSKCSNLETKNVIHFKLCYPKDKRFYFILFTYKCINGLGPEIFSGHFQRFNHGKRTRGDGINLELPKVKLEAFRKSIKFQGPLLFNKLPAELKSETSLLLFKSKLKNYFNPLS